MAREAQLGDCGNGPGGRQRGPEGRWGCGGKGRSESVEKLN